MQENILSESELEFCESWFTPMCLLESLFSDFDNLAEFRKEKFSSLRLYQLPFISDEAIIDFDTTADYYNLTEKEKFQLQKNVTDIFCFGARKFGKCDYIENICTLADGSQVKFKDLINKQKEVICFDERSLTLKKSLARFFDNGIKPCLKITTETNKNITLTLNHPFFTATGWTEAKDLTIGQYIATPRNYQIQSSICPDKKVAKLLGYLLGDGGCSQPAIAFTNINQEIIKEIAELASAFDCEIYQSNITYLFKAKVRSRQKNKIQQLVLDYNINKLAKEKEIPAEVFLWNNNSIALLINRLFACDAHNNYKNYTIEYCSASEKLINQVSHLLLRFGIHSQIKFKEVNLNNKKFSSWRLFISYDYDNFLNQIGIFTKDSGIRRNKKHSTNDRIPNFFIKKHYNSFENKKQYRLRSLLSYNPSRNKLEKLETTFNCPEFTKIINSDIFWEKIKTIEYIGMLPTVATEVDNYDTYISNDIIVHNTKCVEELDLVNDMLTRLDGLKVAFSSVDLIHIREVLDNVKTCFENHQIARLWKQRITGAPDYKFELKNGYKLNSVNFNIGAKNPGRQWYGKHVEKVYIEEASLETEEVFNKRKDALSEFGAMFRVSGMTDFTKTSPAGKTFYNLDLKSHVVNLPQYVNPNWDEKEKKDRIEHYGGEDSIGYRVFVKGEVVEDGSTVFDMQRVREQCYSEDKHGNALEQIKRYEISKDRYPFFKNNLILERPQFAERIFVNADIGEKVTEIIIHAEVEKKYKYIYNIVLTNLTHLEQWEIFKFVCDKLSFDILGFDCGDGMGRALFREAEKIYNKEKLVWYDGSMKIDVDFETDDKGNVIVRDGKPVVKQERMAEWSVKRLQDLLYNGRCIIPEDYKFDTQFSVVVAIISGNIIKYRCVSQQGDHLFDAWKVFAIAQWLKKDFNSAPRLQKSLDIGTFGRPSRR